MLTLSLLTTQQLILLGAAAVVGGVIFGVAGFAFGVIASLFLHHGFATSDVIFIVVAGGLVLNLGLLPRFWSDLDFLRSLPFLTGATLGLPIGLILLYALPPPSIRLIAAVLIIGYCLFALRQRTREPLRLSVRSGRAADTAIGFAGGMVGGICGLGPLIPSIWYGLRGMSKTEQRALTQPFALYVQGLMVGWFLFRGHVSDSATQSIALASPVMLLAAWLGVRLFDAISTIGFQRMIIGLSLIGGVLLLWQQL